MSLIHVGAVFPDFTLFHTGFECSPSKHLKKFQNKQTYYWTNTLDFDKCTYIFKNNCSFYIYVPMVIYLYKENEYFWPLLIVGGVVPAIALSESASVLKDTWNGAVQSEKSVLKKFSSVD